MTPGERVKSEFGLQRFHDDSPAADWRPITPLPTAFKQASLAAAKRNNATYCALHQQEKRLREGVLSLSCIRQFWIELFAQ